MRDTNRQTNREIHIGSARAGPGEKSKGYITVAWLCDASPVEIPVAIINGENSGPTLWIQGGCHGNEYVGPMAIQDLYHQTDPADINGAFVLLPVINILAFRAGTRAAPQDGLDMNRIWPGKPLEHAMHVYAHSEIVVHELVHHLEAIADAVVDCHSGGSPHLMAHYTQFLISEDSKLSDQCRGMAINTGLPLVWETLVSDYAQKASGSISTYMNRFGCPSITVEVGGQGRASLEDRQTMLKCLQGVARHLGILPGEIKREIKPHYIRKGNWVRACRGGILQPLVAPLQMVEHAQPVARVIDLFGRTMEEILSPARGVIVGHRTRAMVNTGEYVCNVGEFHDEKG